MADEFEYDVFVSYSSANKEWVRKDLLFALEKSGLKVCIDFRDFKVGKPAIKNMRDSVLESKHTLLVLTEAYLNSGWTDFENMLSQTIDPTNREGRIVPLLKEKCKLPLEIGYLTYVNFFDPDDWDIAWKQLFEALGAPNKSQPDTPKPNAGSRDTWYLAHPYPMPPNFTGRATELEMLDDWLLDDKYRLFILRALGGFGKSALTWQWINTHVNPAEWTKLVFWSFYEGDASFEHFIEGTLKYLKLEVPQGPRPQIDELLNAMHSQKILLVMDGFERALRAYSSMNAAYQGDEEPKLEDNQLDCVNINAEIFLKSICSLPNIKSKVLMTTRLTPRTVKPRGEFIMGCREVELTAMQKADAVEFFHKQKIKGTHAEIEAVCAPYGHHPLSLRILAGLIIDERKTPGDISVANKLEITDNIIQNKHHVLEVAYNTLSPEQQKLLSTIACFRSPMNYDVLKEISNKPLGKGKKAKAGSIEKLDDKLKTLETRGLLHWDRKANKYDLHPIVRRFAYDRLTAVNRTGTHERLVNYFEAVPKPEKIEKLDDLALVIELYYHIVQAGKYDDAWILFRNRIWAKLYYQLGGYQIQIELLTALFVDGENNPPRLKEKAHQAHCLNELANACSLNGQPRRAALVYDQAIKLGEIKGDRIGFAIRIGNVGQVGNLPIGALKDAEYNISRRIEICREIKDEFWEAVGHKELGRLLSYIGSWDSAEQELIKSINIPKDISHAQHECVALAYRSHNILLITRDPSQSKVNKSKSAIDFALGSLELANKWAKLEHRSERDFVRSYWLLGAAYRFDNQLNRAESHLSEALNLCRSINAVVHEADILLDIARLRYAQKSVGEAKSLADEALTITERCGYVLQGADVNLFLAQYALEQEKDKVKAKEYAETALKLATCDGPPYYYKVAYHEAERFLESLK